MALNLTPDYFEADRKYRQARSPEEKLAALQEMLRTIPKHKASEKKQADIKRRIKELKEAGPSQKKTGAVVDPYHIEHQGAGQVVLLGPPNSGKSSIAAALTKAPVKVTEFPYGTPLPMPGMAYHEDVPIELVDLPPVTPDHVPAGMINALRNADIIAIVVDLSADSVLEDIDAMLAVLAEREITFGVEREGEDGEADDDTTLEIGPQGVIVCTKADVPVAGDNWLALRELRGEEARPAMMKVSARAQEGLAEMMAVFYGMLDKVRVYTKEPGKPADRAKPFVLPRGSTVEELARMIHKDLAASLKFARVWGEHGHAGAQVSGHHELFDRDVVELHA
jgi:hypothetical protein